MTTPLASKSSVDEIRRRFDADVERFSDLDTGQAATVDAPLAMELITAAAMAATPTMGRVLDVGCGAGNNTIRLLRAYGRPIACDLCDLSRPMLDRARDRIVAEGVQEIRLFQGDFREQAWADHAYDVVIAAAVLHHLRDDHDWEAVFETLYRIIRPRGSLWITDLVAQEHPRVQAVMMARYGDYLEALAGAAYREQVFRYIDREDSPRPLGYQLELLRRVGFETVEVLHKNTCFAAFGAIKSVGPIATSGGATLFK
jgi:tRNA (cmo5U34)-methyltransferase